MKKTHIIYIFAVLLLPSVSFAALNGLTGLLTAAKGLVNLIIPVLFGLSLIYFFWGLGQFILHDAGNDKTREDGKKKILWGIVALFVFISIFGIINWIGDTIGITPTSNSQGLLESHPIDNSGLYPSP